MTEIEALVEHGGMTVEQVQRLTSLGILTWKELHAYTRSEEDRRALAGQTSIPEERLLVAAAVANLMVLEGPGSLAARRMISGWPLPEPDTPEGRDFLVWFASANRQELLDLLASVVVDKQAEQDSEDSRLARRRFVLLMTVLILALLAALVVSEWLNLFPPAVEGAAGPAVNDFVRANAVTDLIAMFSAMVLLTILVSAATWVPGRFAGWISGYFGRRIVTPLDTLFLFEAGLDLPPAVVRLVRWIDRNLSLVYVLMGALLVAVVAAAKPTGVSGEWLGLVSGLLLGAILLVRFVAEATAYRRLGMPVAQTVQERYFRGRIVASAIGLTAVIAAIFFITPSVWRWIVPLPLEWGVRQREAHVAAFAATLEDMRVPLEQQATWESEEAEWITWAHARTVDTIKQFRAVEGQGAPESWRPHVEPLALSWLISLIALVIAEYLYVGRVRGLLSLAVFAVGFFAYDEVPRRLAEGTGVSSATALGLVLVVCLSFIMSMTGEIGLGLLFRRRDKRCPSCSAPIDGGARFCSECGSEILA